MRASLYGPWYCIAQRPHHLAGVMLRADWSVDVFTQRGIRDAAPILSSRPNVHHRTALPSRLAANPLTARLAGWRQRANERAMFSAFTRAQADVFVHYRRPSPWCGRIGTLAGPLVYDCVDDWEGFGSGDAEEVRAWERTLCERAQRIWVVSRRLQEKLSEWQDKVTYVPNGVDYPHFAHARDARAERIATLRGKHQPRRLIYVGALQHWFDARLVAEAAARLEGWELQLVGPCQLDEGQRALLARKNIRLLGRRDYQELPLLLAAADVAMIPFVLNDLIRGTSPIKLYEYLAAGLPVVASSMPEVLPHVAPGVVGCADDPAEFARLVEECDAAANPDTCQAIARECSWDARFLPALDEIRGAV
jgi:glycosyltransferase involved in cell wall biosynthesis